MKPAICFVSPSNYAVLSGDPALQHIGGAEVQQAMIARELARRGHDVSFVVLDHGQPDGELIDGVRIFKCYRPTSGIPRLRFIHPRTTGLWSAMHRAAADIYYQRGADSLTGLAARWCRRHGRRFVFALAHDENCDPHMARLCGRVERRLYRYGLTRAHVILAQTRHQQALLRSGFDLPASVVPSCCTASPRCHGQSPGCHGQAQRRHADVGRVIDPTTAAPDSPIRCRILWVGRLSEEKRPEWILQLARDLPDLDFTAVGRCNAGSSYGRRLTEQLASCPNVTHHDHILHNQMPDLFRRADLLCCTSASEGFPNVFLEAWTSGTPVLSTVDPDGIIVTHRLGEVVGSLEQMTQRLRGVSADRQTWRDHGRAAQRYVRENHSVAATVDALLDALWPTAPTSRERNASGPAARPTAHRVYAP